MLFSYSKNTYFYNIKVKQIFLYSILNTFLKNLQNREKSACDYSDSISLLGHWTNQNTIYKIKTISKQISNTQNAMILVHIPYTGTPMLACWAVLHNVA